MIKIAAIVLAALFSTGYAVEVDETNPEPTTLEQDRSPVPASSSCEDKCAEELAECEAQCTTPMCFFQCDQDGAFCYNCCATGH